MNGLKFSVFKTEQNDAFLIPYFGKKKKKKKKFYQKCHCISLHHPVYILHHLISSSQRPCHYTVIIASVSKSSGIPANLTHLLPALTQQTNHTDMSFAYIYFNP